MSEPVIFLSGLFCGGLIFGSMSYMSGKKKGEEDFKKKVYDQHLDNYLEWTASGGLRLKKEVLEKELVQTDNDICGIELLFKQAISLTREKFAESKDRDQAAKFFLDKAKLIFEVILAAEV